MLSMASCCQRCMLLKKITQQHPVASPGPGNGRPGNWCRKANKGWGSGDTWLHRCALHNPEESYSASLSLSYFTCTMGQSVNFARLV